MGISGFFGDLVTSYVFLKQRQLRERLSEVDMRKDV